MSEHNSLKNPAKEPKTITWPVLITFGVGVIVIGLLLNLFLIPKSQTEYDAQDAVISEKEMIVSAGTDVRAGRGAPSQDYGVEGDIYLNVSSGDVYLRSADSWGFESNLAALAHEQVTDPQSEDGDPGTPGELGSVGPAGPKGEPGETGQDGQDGQDGTQVSLGKEKPTGTCDQQDDIFINVKDMEFFTCVDKSWQQFTY